MVEGRTVGGGRSRRMAEGRTVAKIIVARTVVEKGRRKLGAVGRRV